MDTITSAPGKAPNSDPENCPESNRKLDSASRVLRRPPNIELRPREHLTEREVVRLMDAARNRGRYGHRDATMILLAYRHGLRVSELCGLRWTQLDMEMGTVYVSRLKGSASGNHPLGRKEIEALEKIPKTAPQVFVNERRRPVSASGFRKLMERVSDAAGFSFPVHPHMLRHACGYKLANDGVDTRAIQAYLGHKQIQHTVHYTELAAGRFRGFWED